MIARMNRRETAINALLGVLLLFAFGLCVAACFAAMLVAFYVTGLLFNLFLPEVSQPPVYTFYGLLVIYCLWYAVRHLRKGRWWNAFFSFAMIPILISSLLSGPHSFLGQTLDYSAIWCLVFFTVNNCAPTRYELMLGSFVVAAAIAVNTGLLGSGTAAQVTVYCISGAVLSMFVLHFRRQQIQQSTSQPNTLLGR